MKPFRYRLQLLKDLRERDRDEALQSYGVALRKRMNQQETSDSIEQRIEGIGKAIQDRGQQRFTASMHSQYYSAMKEAKLQLKESNALVEEFRSKELEQQQEYLHRKSSHDVLQRLYDRRRDEHLASEFKEEEKVLEDLANARSSIPNPVTTT